MKEMTYMVFASVKEKLTPEDEVKINKRFREVHNIHFKQWVDQTPKNGFKGEPREMDHDAGFWDYEGKREMGIPCHWDYDHMIQTQKDIKKVLKELGYTGIRTRVSY